MADKPASSGSFGAERQFEIYQGGMVGQRTAVPVPLSLLEQKAKEVLSAEAFDYVSGGAGGEDTMRANRAAFGRWRIVPRMLRDVSHRDLNIELFGRRLPAPLLLAPIGVQSIVQAEAETAAARAAASLGVPFVLSTAGSRSIEQIAEAMGSAPRWYQLYWSKDAELAASMVARAERAGYSAIVVTLDTQMLAWRERDLHHPFLPFLKGEGLANYFSDPVFRSRLEQPPEQNPIAAIRHWASNYSNTALTWDDIPFLRRHTKLPILLKGILHTEDAAKAVGIGVDGVIVSNHGGRQVDGVIAALDALPGVVESVRGRVPVLFDSGIRRGADAFKALALGAKAVLFGRPYIWGLAVAGETGVREVVMNFLADLDLTMALSGYATLSDLTPSTLIAAES
jgi:lactate 2-monooxygenase